MFEKDNLVCGRCKSSGEWIKGYLIRGNRTYIATAADIEYMVVSASEFLGMQIHEVYSETVRRFSGLIDVNRRLVFEGDIIAHKFGDDIGVVKLGVYRSPCDGHEAKHVGFYVDWVKGSDKDALRRDLGYWIIDSGSEVIGNVFDNSELINA